MELNTNATEPKEPTEPKAPTAPTETSTNFMNKDMKDMMESISSTLKSIVPEDIKNTLNSFKGTGVYNSQRDIHLKKVLDDKKDRLNELPFEIGRAEKNYYEFNKGVPGGDNNYKSLIYDRYATTADEFRRNSIEKQQDYATEISRALKQYHSQKMLSKQSDNLLKIRRKEHKELINKINKYESILETSERKVVYENKNSDSLFLYRRIMLFIYYTAIIGYIIFGNFIPDKLYNNYTIWGIIFIAIIMPIILNMVIKWMFVMYDAVSYWFAELPTKDVYDDL